MGRKEGNIFQDGRDSKEKISPIFLCGPLFFAVLSFLSFASIVPGPLLRPRRTVVSSDTLIEGTSSKPLPLHQRLNHNIVQGFNRFQGNLAFPEQYRTSERRFASAALPITGNRPHWKKLGKNECIIGLAWVPTFPH
jgi:hypothetical protein